MWFLVLVVQFIYSASNWLRNGQGRPRGVKKDIMARKFEVQRKTVTRSAQVIGHLGGIKGGYARAAKMTPEERSESARKAVQARWERYRARNTVSKTGDKTDGI